LLFIALLFFGKHTQAKNTSIIHDYFYLIFLQGLAVALFYLIKYKVYTKIELPENANIKALVKYSLIGFGANFLFYFVYRFDYFFVKKWCLAADLGNYIQASKLVQVLLLVPQILASSVFPQTASGIEKTFVQYTIAKWIKQLLWIYLGLIILVLLLGNSLFVAVFGATFSKMATPVLILLPGIFGLSVSALLSAYFSGIKKNNYNLYAAILALATMALLTFILKNNYSIVIAAAISSIAYLVEFGFCFYVFKKKEFDM
jgi:O-antigen/teichoic acid export membrane protein